MLNDNKSDVHLSVTDGKSELENQGSWCESSANWDDVFLFAAKVFAKGIEVIVCILQWAVPPGFLFAAAPATAAPSREAASWAPLVAARQSITEIF